MLFLITNDLLLIELKFIHIESIPFLYHISRRFILAPIYSCKNSLGVGQENSMVCLVMGCSNAILCAWSAKREKLSLRPYFSSPKMGCPKCFMWTLS